MKSINLLRSAVMLTIMVISHLTFAQEEVNPIEISVTSINDHEVYTFKEQRNIPLDKVESFTTRMASLHDYIDKISFNPEEQNYSIHFLTTPSEAELAEVLVHFHVNDYSLVKQQ